MTVYLMLSVMWAAGVVVGAVCWDMFRTQAVRQEYERRLRSAESSEDAWKRMYLYAEGEKAMLAHTFPPNDGHSRKVVPIRSAS